MGSSRKVTSSEARSLSRPEEEVAREAAVEPEQLFSLLGHLYRGEMSRANTWRRRLDATTNWAVVLTATVVTWVFTGPDRPHYVLLIAILAVSLFLLIEARRYRSYDVWRTRVRLLEENLFGNALDPRGTEEADWRERLSRDFRRPRLKIPFLEAASRRLRRVYLWILSLLLLAWILRVFVFRPEDVDLYRALSIEHIPGGAVLGMVSGYYAALLAVAFWPMRRRAKGRLRERDEDDEE